MQKYQLCTRTKYSTQNDVNRLHRFYNEVLCLQGLIAVCSHDECEELKNMRTVCEIITQVDYITINTMLSFLVSLHIYTLNYDSVYGI